LPARFQNARNVDGLVESASVSFMFLCITTEKPLRLMAVFGIGQYPENLTIGWSVGFDA
jgi:hypothetical protein